MGYDILMCNKIKIAAVVLTVIVGMVLYKEHFEKKKKQNNDNDAQSKADDDSRWN